MDESELIDDLIARFCEERKHGIQPSLSDLCADHPHLLQKLESRLKGLKRMEAVLPQTGNASGEDRLGSPQLKEGLKIHEYELVKRLGSGGFGQVWKAVRPGGFEVALKFVPMHSEVGPKEKLALDAIQRIPRHQNRLTVSAYWTAKDGTLVIDSELADMSLQASLELAQAEGRDGIPAQGLFRYMHDVADGLDDLHRNWVLHLDIKPANLFLLNGHAKVGDYGLAQVLKGGTAATDGWMTPLFAAPEVRLGKPTRRSDQYSLAITYCMLRTGQPPFSVKPTRHEIGTVDLVMLPEVERPVVARALQDNARNRWPNCRAFVKALKPKIKLAPPDRADSINDEIAQLAGMDEGEVLTALENRETVDLRRVQAILRKPTRLGREYRRLANALDLDFHAEHQRFARLVDQVLASRS